jgi:hypothetical protein
MSITYNLTIGSLGRKLAVESLSNVVYEVSVSVNAQSTEHPQFSYSCGGNIILDISQIDANSFIPFENITQEIVVGWLLANEGVQSIEEFSYVKTSINNIQARIDELDIEDDVPVNWTITDSVPETIGEVTEETNTDILEP